MEAAEIRVKGHVQGVGFRYFTYSSAMELSIHGLVKNLPDGSVLVHAVGSTEAMAAFRQRLHEGPPFGHVTSVEEKSLALEDAPYPDFQITH